MGQGRWCGVIPKGAVEAIENAVLRGLRKANMNRLKERGSGETAAPADAAHGLMQPTPAIATDSPHDPYEDDFGNEFECTHCNGDGDCDANANPLWDCDDDLHQCHACGGSGLRKDQRVF